MPSYPGCAAMSSMTLSIRAFKHFLQTREEDHEIAIAAVEMHKKDHGKEENSSRNSRSPRDTHHDGRLVVHDLLPQEEFNQTPDRKSPQPSLGVACMDCHVNFHTTGQFHLNPDTRPQLDRLRLDTVSLRGVFNQQIHGSKRSLRSVEDFTEANVVAFMRAL